MRVRTATASSAASARPISLTRVTATTSAASTTVLRGKS